MTLQLKSVDFNDFSGGITDKYLDSSPNTYQIADNFLVLVNKRLGTRPGTRPLFSGKAQISATADKVSQLLKFNYNEELLATTGNRLFHYTAGAWSHITGLGGNDLFPSSSSSSSKVTQGQVDRHIYVASSEGQPPAKIIKTGSGFKSITAGLPSVPEPSISGTLQPAYDLANSLKTKFNAHIANLSQHSASDAAANTVSSANATSQPTLLALVTELLTKYAAHESDSEKSSGRTKHPGQEKKNSSLSSTTAPTTVNDALDRLRDIKTKFNAHDADTGSHTTGSLNQVTEVDGAIQTFIYAFHYHHSYVSDGITFEDFGPTTSAFVDGVMPPTQTAVSISGLTHISNTGLLNYDATNTKIWIYRTINGGTTLYKIAEVTPGTTSYSDTQNDESLVNNAVIYTTGGVLDNDPPPSDASQIHIAGAVAYYASGRTLRQSIPLDYDSCPIDLFVEFSSEIVAVSSARNNVIVLTKDGVYRVDGIFDELGRGGMVAQRLDTSVVCVSKMSVVQANDLIFFATEEGFVSCNGFQVNQITTELNESYSLLTATDAQKDRIFGVFHKTEQRIYWTAQDNSSLTDPNCIWVLDLTWGLRPNSSFTKITGADDSFRPTSLEIWENKLIWGSASGCVMKFDPAYTSDVMIDTSVADSAWNEIEIPYHFRSMGTSFGTHYARKWVPQVLFIIDSDTDISIQPGGVNDDSSVVTNTSEIRIRQRFDWADPTVLWSDSSPFVWNQTSVVKQKRMFNGRQVRCSYKQIDLQPAYTNIAASDNYAIAGVNASLKTAYIDPISGYSWPLSIIGMDIYFEDDGYSKAYEILSRSSTTIQFDDSGNQISLNGNRKWVIRGKSRDERFTILANILYYDVFSDSYDAYPGAKGGNA